MRDSDFDLPPPTERRRPPPFNGRPEEDLRLVLNPLVGFALLLATLLLARDHDLHRWTLLAALGLAAATRRDRAALLAVALLAALFLLAVLDPARVPAPFAPFAFLLLLALALRETALGLRVHCLDCGDVEPLARWRRHACEIVRDRRALGQAPPRALGVLPMPSVHVQLALWIVALVAAAILLARYLP